MRQVIGGSLEIYNGKVDLFYPGGCFCQLLTDLERKSQSMISTSPRTIRILYISQQHVIFIIPDWHTFCIELHLELLQESFYLFFSFQGEREVKLENKFQRFASQKPNFSTPTALV